MLNKLQFNNLVITNKQKIQQVKTQTIQRLVQKLRKLKLLLEKKPDDQKTQERFRKNTMCLEELKKLKRIELMKHALILDKNVTAVLTNGRSSPEEVAVALTASNKIMIDLLRHFREQLHLKDDDSSWKKEIMRTSKRRIKISRTEQKRQKRKDLKDQKALARKREEWLKGQNSSHNSTDNEEENTVMNISTLGVWKIEPVESKLQFEQNLQCNKAKSLAEKSVVRKNFTDTAISNKTKETNIHENKKAHLNKEKKVKSKTTDNSPVPFPSERVHNHKATDKPPKSFSSERDDENDSEDFFKQSNVTQKHVKAENTIENITHVIDPFFITESGENYRSTAVIMRDGKLIEPTLPVESGNIWNGANARKRMDHSEQQHGRKNPVEKSYNRKDATKTINNKELKGLHPSWGAKQKQKPIITTFQGKKTKIDDDYDNYNNYNKNHIETNSITKIARKNITDNNKPNEIHPSWEAKQKFRPIIADFKGKKITFDDNENIEDNAKSNNKLLISTKSQLLKKAIVPNTDLHPSWVAKQKLKPAISVFQGKKISFNDGDV